MEVVLDGFFQHNPTARGVPRAEGEHKGFETLDMNVLQARAHRCGSTSTPARQPKSR